MSYIPPHKRQGGGRSPTPTSLAPRFNRSLSLRSSSKSERNKHMEIVYDDHAINEWFPIGLGVDRDLMSALASKLASDHQVEQSAGLRSSTLLANDPIGEAAEVSVVSPWTSIAEFVTAHMISKFRVLKSVDEAADAVEVKPYLVARIGKIIFRLSRPSTAEDVRSLFSSSSFNSSWRTFCTNVSPAYFKDVTDVIVSSLGLEAGVEKDVYYVKISDKLRPTEIIACKCRLSKETLKLEIYKVRLIVVRHMVVDVSCLEKNMDLRLMIYAKRTMKALPEDERTAITDLVGSAIIECDVKGGLKWPLGEKSSECNRYVVVGAWHLISRRYMDSSFEMKLIEADRFDFDNSTGESTLEVNLKMRNLASALGEENPETESIRKMLEQSLKLIWENFLSEQTEQDRPGRTS